MRSALKGVEGVNKAKVKLGSAVVTAGKDVKTEDLITALKTAGFEASLKEDEKEKEKN